LKRNKFTLPVYNQSCILFNFKIKVTFLSLFW